MEEPDSKGRTGTHAAAGGQIAVVMNLQPALDAEHSQDGPDNRMLDVGGALAVLDFGIDQRASGVRKRAADSGK